MNFDIFAIELDRFFVHICWIEDRTSSEDAPGGEPIDDWVPRGGEGSEIVFKCRKEEIEVLNAFVVTSRRKEVGPGIQTKLIRLYLEGATSIVGNVRMKNINGDGKVYEITVDYDVIADEGTGVADTQEMIIQEVLDS